MAIGDRFPSESSTQVDPVSGAMVRQITAHPSIHHHPFCYVPAFDDAMQRLCFVSHRGGMPQIFVEQRGSGELMQVTDRDDLVEWSLHPSADGRYVYYTGATAGYRVELATLEEQQVIDLRGTTKAAGMVAAGMGTTSLSHDGIWWAVPVRRGERAQLLVVNTVSGAAHVACENDNIGHPQFHPNDANLIRYGGPYDRRLWITARDGNGHRLVYQRDVAKKEWIVHESWHPHARQILTANWPHGVMAVDIDSGATRWVTRFNAWHPMVAPSGRWMVTDTKHPDIGIQLFEIADHPTVPRLLCLSQASSRGEHWNGNHCPYDDGPVDVYAPQHTHPHPSFSPDGSRVIFTSDRSGYPQIYEVQCPT
jgi:oligogalacturonide lyase